MYSNDPLVWLFYRAVPGCEGPAEWTRHPRHSMAIHPTHAKMILASLKKMHPSQEFKLVEMPEEDIPF